MKIVKAKKFTKIAHRLIEQQMFLESTGSRFRKYYFWYAHGDPNHTLYHKYYTLSYEKFIWSQTEDDVSCYYLIDNEEIMSVLIYQKNSYYSKKKDKLYLGNVMMYTKPEYRGMGYSKRLCQFLEKDVIKSWPNKHEVDEIKDGRLEIYFGTATGNETERYFEQRNNKGAYNTLRKSLKFLRVTTSELEPMKYYKEDDYLDWVF